MNVEPWLFYALIAAAAAAMVGILGKVGMKDIDSSLATAVRSIVMSLFLISYCSISGVWAKAGAIHGRALTMIGLSGVAGAVSWLFYFKAIQIGTVSQVAPIDKLSMPLAIILAVVLLGDRPTVANWIGVILIAAGGYLAAMPRGG